MTHMASTIDNIMQGSDTLAKIRALGFVAVSASVAPARDRVCKALSAVAAYHRRARNLVLDVEARSHVGLRPTMQRVADEVPRDAGIFAEGRDRVVRNAQDRAMNDERRKWAREVAGKSTDTIAQLTKESVDAFRAFDLALVGDRVKWRGPSSLRDDAPKTLEAILLEQRLAAELESAGVDHIEQVYTATLQVGDIDRATRIETAARSYLLRVIDDGARGEESRKRARTGRTTDGATMSKAITLLATFEEQRNARVPAELKNAEAVRDAFDALFSMLLGMHAKYLSSEAFAARYLQGGPREHDAYEIDPRWPMRFSPPNAPLDPDAAPAAPMRVTRL